MYKPFEFVEVIFVTIIEGTMSQICYLGPRSYCMQFRKLYLQIFQTVSRFFWDKIKTKT